MFVVMRTWFVLAALSVLLLIGRTAAQTEPTEPEEAGWSAWSPWSPCSRSCNGGVAHSLRKCGGGGARESCRGDSAKYRICNMQACPDPSGDFRAAQCSAYNPVPYRGRLYEWLPYRDPEAPCALACHARGHSFAARLAPRVRDGTRCRDGSLDMCVDGRCMAVGCDLQLGSERRVDACGVCGGDGSSCRRPRYVWARTPPSPCSVSCGGGYQMSRPACRNKSDGKEVDERLCDGAARPPPQIQECNPLVCPPTWVTDSWSPCSSSCGGGRQSRQVHCAQSGADGARVPVAAEQCQPRQRPLTERPCNPAPCPGWLSGPWSGCSVTCGRGQKSRSVACRDAAGQHSEDCDVEAMPATRTPCDSGLVCEDPETYLSSDIFKMSQEDGPPVGVLPKPVKPKKNSISTQPSYVVSEWGPCSVTCGRGLQTRTVECKILLDFSRTVATIKDHECPILRPPNVKTCHPRPCSFDLGGKEGRKGKGQSVGIEVTYSWKDKGFTPCSASCLGGTRESVIQCLRDHDQAVVKPSLCDISAKPDAITQTCNDMPCPPKWNVTEYGPCSKPCGGGLMRRRVQCLHEMIRGADNALAVEAGRCPPPQPQEEMFCNVFDCAPHWKADRWSKCSKSCGGGTKTRKVHCMKEMAFGQVLEFAPSDCAKLRQPRLRKPCAAKPCPPTTTADDNQAQTRTRGFVQARPQRRVFLKAGGSAVVFAGTSLKVRCPGAHRANKTGVAWYKDDRPVEPGKRTKISLKGALRIRRVSGGDSGKYSCVSGFSRADIRITVRPPPVEERTVENLGPPSAGFKETDRTMEEKLSHEHEHPLVVHPKTKLTQKPRTDNSAQDTFEDNRRQYHYKTNLNRNQDSHQDFGNKGKPSSTEDTVVELSTLGRVPLYIQARQTTRPQPVPAPTQETPLDSDELLPNRDYDKSWQKLKTKTYSSSEEKSPNQVLPPRYGDTHRQTYDGSLLAKKKPKEAWHGDLFSDQEELSVGTPHGGKGFPGNPAHSGASSTHGSSHIKNLLMKLPSLGGATAAAPEEQQQQEGDSSEEPDREHPTRMSGAGSFVLGRGSAEGLRFEWVLADWSPCSRTCDGDGFQARGVQCVVRLHNVSRGVDGSLCEDAGLPPAPAALRSCGREACPRWEAEPWSQCLESACFRWHASFERRAVLCRAANGTDLAPRHCDEGTRPRRRRECYSARCTAEWRTEHWSQCTAACGRRGFQSRILRCVWRGGARPAGDACRDQQRPIVLRACTAPPCQSSERKPLH